MNRLKLAGGGAILLICSLYDTQLAPGKHKKTLGVLRSFIPLGQDKEEG